MTHLARLGTTTALVTCMATPTLADVSANDVWDSFTSLYRAVGMDVDATKAQSGNRLRISDLKLSADFPFDLGSITITTTGFDLIEKDDGTVDIKLPDNMPMAMALTLPNDIFATATMDYRIKDYSAQVSGDPDDFTVIAEMGRAEIEVTSLNVTGLDLQNQDFDLKFNFTMDDMRSEATITSGTLLQVSQNITYGAVVMNGAFTGKDENAGNVESTFAVTMDSMEYSNTVAIPATGIDLMNLPAQLREGLSFQATSEVFGQASQQHMTINGEMATDQTTTVASSATSMAFSKDGMTINAHSSDYAIDYAMAELPFPIKLAFSNVAFKMGLPLLKSDSEQGFGYALDFDGITMADALWDQFDPTAELPRTPATLVLDLSGKGMLFVDLLDIEAMREVVAENIKFGELTALTLNDMDITAIGARLTGKGLFTFDNSDLDTFDGLPAPSGAATFHMAGLNSMIDALLKIGLLENDAAFGMRMGLGLFTVAGDKKDTLTSEIVVTPDGQITANGVRLK
ncbi:MAG: DUF2125 domain-containing protein [Marinosulfonomonas sp.]|nr:DUF2125 domain-containing protein [Marinosulfonomonas sp.]